MIPYESQPAPKQPENAKEIHHHHYHGRHGFNFGRFLLAVLVIIFGLFLIARNTGWLPSDLAIDWTLVWPIFIIIAGLSLMSGRGWLNVSLGILSLILVFSALGFMFIAGPGGNSYRGPWGMMEWRNRDDNLLSRQDFSVALDESADKGYVEIQAGGSEIDLVGGTDDMVEGSFGSSASDLVIDSQVDNGLQRVVLSAPVRGMMMGLRRASGLDAKITHRLPIDLRISAGASDMRLDLTRVVLDSLSLDAGASDIGLSLGDKSGLTEVDISAGASSIEIEVPKDSGVQVSISSALSSGDFPGFIQADPRTYKTDNYESAKKIINIRLGVGLSSVSIKRK